MSQFWSLWRRVCRRIVEAPVTLLVMSVSIALFALTSSGLEGSSTAQRSLQRTWGAAVPLTWVPTDPGERNRTPELYGPFDVWAGEWWRLPISTFHHADVLHLMLNVTTVVWLGRLLEIRWGSIPFLGLTVGASLITPLPEFLTEQYVVGISGICCAYFGVLLIERTWDRALAVKLPDDLVVVAFMSLVIFGVLGVLEAIPIANGAHVVGLVYGAIVAWGWSHKANLRLFPIRRRSVRSAPPTDATAVDLPPPSMLQSQFLEIEQKKRSRRMGWQWWLSLLAMHGLLVVPYWFMVHQSWIGRYHWQAGLNDRGMPRPDEAAQRSLDRALELDPSLSGLWLDRAQQLQLSGDMLGSWQRLIRGLRHQSGDPELWTAARRMWRRLVMTPDRAAAEQIVTDAFGDAGPRWLAEIRKSVRPPMLIGSEPEPSSLSSGATASQPAGLETDYRPPDQWPRWHVSPSAAQSDQPEPPHVPDAVEGREL
jgi:rhomboid protease GluP